MSDVITDDERHEAATEEPTTVGCPSLGLGKLQGGFDGTEALERPIDPTAPEMKKASKYGLLANGVQMIRYASGKTVTLVGKRERDPSERHGGRTDKVIYKVTVSRETHTAAVDVDGATKVTVFCTANDRLEHHAVALMNSFLMFNARRQRHKKERLNRRKAERAGTPASPRQEVAK